jgi:hypothetical protein
MQGQNSTPLCLLNNSCVSDLTQRMTSTPSATQRQSINTPTTMLGTSSHTPPSPAATSKADWTCCIESSPAPGIRSTATFLSRLENVPTRMSNIEARVIITNPLWTQATDRNLRQRQWHLQPQVVSTPQSVVSGGCSVHRFGHSELTPPVFFNRLTPGAI